MKVAILMPLAVQCGGAEVLLRQLVHHGRNHGIEWLVLFFEQGPFVAQMRAFGIATEVIPTGRLRSLLSFAGAVFLIARLLRKFGADVVLSWMPKAHIYGSIAAKMLGIPAVWFQHGIPNSRMDWLIGLLPAALILAPSKTVAQLQRTCSPRHMTAVAYPGLEDGQFEPDLLPCRTELRQKLNLPVDALIIGSIGRLHSEKGMDVLVESVASLLNYYPNVYLVIVGGRDRFDATYCAQLTDFVTEQGLQDRVRMVGYQTNIPEWLHAFDVFALVSRSEGFGIALLEAMALRKPVIATTAGGPTELIEHGVNGVLVQHGNVQELSHAIKKYVQDPLFAQGVSNAARKTALRFRVENFVDGVVTGLRNCCRN